MKINVCNQIYEVIVEHKAIKHVYLRVVDEQTLKVTCSPKVSHDYILAFLQSKQDWILQAMKKREQLQHSTKFHIINQTIYYLGECYSIIYEQKDKKKLWFNNDLYYVQLPNGSSEDALRLFYRYHEKDLVKIIDELRVKWDCVMDEYHLPHPTIRVKYLTGRHGQCTHRKNEIVLSTRMIHFSKECIDAVLWHEYCHLVVPNHSKRFYDLVLMHMPNYNQLKDQIK